MTDEQRDDMLIDTHVMVRDLRIIILGTNGGGVIREIEEMKTDDKTIIGRLANMEKTMMTRADCTQIRDNVVAKRRTAWKAINTVILAAVALGGFIVALLVYLGKLGA